MQFEFVSWGENVDITIISNKKQCDVEQLGRSEFSNSAPSSLHSHAICNLVGYIVPLFALIEIIFYF
jgi:hypothetical protein